VRICACNSGPRMNVRNLRAHFGSPSVRSLRDLIYFHVHIPIQRRKFISIILMYPCKHVRSARISFFALPFRKSSWNTIAMYNTRNIIRGTFFA